jgi:HSF-type DNA-binding
MTMYRDYSNAKEMDLLENLISSTSSRTNHSTESNFPAKLHYMLEEIRRDGLENIISWMPHGRCFMVHKQKEFEKEILPK